MVNAGDLFICLVAGLAIPLAILDGIRALAGPAALLVPQESHPARSPRLWLLALLAGPGLFAERMLDAWRAGALSPADRVNALVITLGWAAIYGFVVLGLARAVLPA